MALRTKLSALAVTAAVGGTLGLAASPASAAANHWGEGLGTGYSNSRQADAEVSGALVTSDVYWNGYRVGVDGYVGDTKADGLGAVAQVGYRYWNGSSWKWTTRNLAKASGGQGDHNGHKVHSLVKVKDLVVRACTANSGGLVNCSAWK
ncbi:hypothetical protein [Streptomyces sp. XD-27]|uniref:hypothetical protein n=1 Tax=Streptomyces sp. XD-27 TaxID=3062779 RepID=UPI0026F460F0|nr:hypothetical protein [Streptomyces sp. XD-27]WKX69245.1 hypothetical protein Q3Y56_04265 [Streptomyces sp. XD-27]